VSETRRRLERAVDELPRGLREHVLRVVGEARRLARLHRVDEERAVIAALGHDLLRAIPPAELLRLAESAGQRPSELERQAPVLLHGPLSALLMAERFGVEDRAALDAARYHTTGRAGMSVLERVIFVADKIEPRKVAGWPELAEVRRLADESLERALVRYLDEQARLAQRRGWRLHPNSIACRKELTGGQ